MSELPPLTVSRRLKALCEEVQAVHDEVDVLYVADLSCIRWLTSFTGSNATAVIEVAAQQLHFFTDSRYGEQAQMQLSHAGGHARVHVPTSLKEQSSLLHAIIADRRVGVDGRTITAQLFSDLSRDFTVTSVHLPFDDLRRAKDESEIARLERAAHIADEALQAVVGDGLSGKSERQVKAELEYQMLLRGADAASFDTIVAAGENAALPHHRPSDRIIGREDAVIIDMGAEVDGYHSDMTRTIRVGHMHREVSFMLAATIAAQNAALSLLRAGVSTADVDHAAREVYREAGVLEYFTHGLGHGVGLSIHEEPFLSRRPGSKLQEGEVVTIEPGLYRVGVGGVRIEDLVVITCDGYRSLSRTRKDLSCPPSALTI
jgi:Xaa-Pro aminopeptidase